MQQFYKFLCFPAGILHDVRPRAPLQLRGHQLPSKTNHRPIFSHVLQRHSLLCLLHKRTHRKRRLVGDGQHDKTQQHQARGHVSHQDSLGVDQGCDLYHHGDLHAAGVWTRARVAALPPNGDIHVCDVDVLHVHGKGFCGVVPALFVVFETEGVGGP